MEVVSGGVGAGVRLDLADFKAAARFIFGVDLDVTLRVECAKEKFLRFREGECQFDDVALTSNFTFTCQWPTVCCCCVVSSPTLI